MQTFRVALVPAESNQVLALPAQSTLDAEQRTHLQASWKAGHLVVELGSELRTWALSGVIAVRYSDSENRIKRDVLLGTTSGDPAKPETWSQLTRTALCNPTPLVRAGD